MGICYDISAIMASMLRSQGVEVKLVTGYTPNIEGVYHAWNSVYDENNDSWITVDATYDIAMYKADKKYKMKKSSSDYTDIKYQY
jgi:transglutaminase-like putative cysteine protease